MSNTSDFVIENGVLTKYVGPGGDVVIPEGVTSIGKESFWCNNHLKSVTISDGVTNIGRLAFLDCKRLTNVAIPNGLTDIGDRAFKGCKGLADSSGFVIIKDTLYDYCGSGEDVTIPDNVTRIGVCAFFENKRMKNVSIPDSVTSIGNSAFFGCKCLKSVTIPRSVSDIGDNAFKGCTSLTSVEVSHWLPGLNSLPQKGLMELRCTEDAITKIPANYRVHALLGFVSNPGSDLYSERARSYLDYVKKNAGKLINTAFERTELLYFMCEQSLIPAKDFDDYLAMAEKCESAEYKAILLDYQSQLGTGEVAKARERKETRKEEYYDALVERIAVRKPSKGIEGMTFVISGKLHEWGFLKDVKSYLEKYGAKLGTSVTKKTDFLVTNDIESMSDKYKKAIELGVPVVTEDEFNEMVGKRYPNAEKIMIPSWMKEIPGWAFRDCHSLKSVVIPVGVTSVGDEAFLNCLNLKSVTLPLGLTSIGYGAFYGCHNLKDATIPSTVINWSSSSFEDCPNLTIHAPAGSYAEQYAKEHGIPFMAE